MSLLLIVRKLWRYKLFTLPIFALTVAGAIYVLAIKAPTYESVATYILVNPPPPPTDAKIAADPALGRIDSDNPYLRFSDLTVVAQVLATKLSSEEARKELEKQGADPDYKAEPSPEFGFSSPIIKITGTGTTPNAAANTANLVGEAMTNQLDQMQSARGVDKLYRISVEVIVGAHDATLKASGKLRALVAVFALGAILMFIAVSVMDAISALRMEWAPRRSRDDNPTDEATPAEIPRPESIDEDPTHQTADAESSHLTEDHHLTAQHTEDDELTHQPAEAESGTEEEAPHYVDPSKPSLVILDPLSDSNPDEEAWEWPLLAHR
jgi:capsular polysaccharide biosynthesis protein